MIYFGRFKEEVVRFVDRIVAFKDFGCWKVRSRKIGVKIAILWRIIGYANCPYGRRLTSLLI